MNGVQYKQDFLMKNSLAYEMWSEMQKAKGDERNKAQKKLEQHLKSVDQTKQMYERK